MAQVFFISREWKGCCHVVKEGDDANILIAA